MDTDGGSIFTRTIFRKHSQLPMRVAGKGCELARGSRVDFCKGNIDFLI